MMVETIAKMVDCCRPLPDFGTPYRNAKTAIALRIFNGLGLEDSEQSEMVRAAVNGEPVSVAISH